MKQRKNKKPDEHCLKGLKILKTTFEKEGRYSVFSFNDGSDGRLPFVLKSNKLKVNLLQNIDKDGNH